MTASERIALLQRLGTWVHACRLRLGLSQDTLAEHTGVSQSTIGRLEHGRLRSIDFFTCYVVVRYLNACGRAAGLSLPDFAVVIQDGDDALVLPEIDEVRAFILREFDTCPPWQRPLFWACVRPLAEFLGESRRKRAGRCSPR